MLHKARALAITSARLKTSNIFNRFLYTSGEWNQGSQRLQHKCFSYYQNPPVNLHLSLEFSYVVVMVGKIVIWVNKDYFASPLPWMDFYAFYPETHHKIVMKQCLWKHL